MFSPLPLAWCGWKRIWRRSGQAIALCMITSLGSPSDPPRPHCTRNLTGIYARSLSFTCTWPRSTTPRQNKSRKARHVFLSCGSHPGNPSPTCHAAQVRDIKPGSSLAIHAVISPLYKSGHYILSVSDSWLPPTI